MLLVAYFTAVRLLYFAIAIVGLCLLWCSESYKEGCHGGNDIDTGGIDVVDVDKVLLETTNKHKELDRL